MKRQSTILYILIFIMLAAVAFLVFVAAPGSEINTVPVILPERSDDDDDAEEDIAPQVIEVTPDTVQTVIRTMSRADSYSRTICSESFWSGGSTRRNIDVWVRGDQCKMETSRTDGSDTMHLLIVGGEKTIWYADRYGSYTGPANEDEGDRYQALLSYERILDVDKRSISDAGYAEYLGEMCVYVRYSSGELGYDNLCYVSLATGLVMGEESYDGGTLVIRVTSTVPDLSEPDESIFAKP